MTETLVKVKTERPDEAEIRELAAKMVEANKAKLLAASVARAGANPMAAAQLAGANGQMGILNFLTRKPPAGSPVQPERKVEDEKKTPAPDEASWKGHFGWDMLGKCHIPYIFRTSEKYVAVRMVEVKLLNKYLNYLHQDIYSCTCIRSYYITEVEARLFNEINMRHCDGQFGRETFTQKDLVVRLSDANEFYNFLDVCYNKLLRGTTNCKDKCGFIRINKESVVPYTVRDGMKFVPLFYFEGETDNLKLKADQLKGWDLSYLKFCCKVQGIRNELFASETCSVISLTDIKSYFPPGTEFEEYWPNKVVDSQLLISSKGSLSSSGGQWTRAPTAPPPGVSQNVAVNPAAPAQPARGGRRATPAAPPRTHNSALNAAAAMVNAAHTNLSPSTLQALNGWNFPAGLTQAQTQQVLRLAQAQAAAARYGLAQQQQRARQMQHQYPNSAMAMGMAQQQQVAPPPLVRNNSANMNNMGNMMNNKSPMNGNAMNNKDNRRRVTQIPEPPLADTTLPPYKIQNVMVESKHVACINMKPYSYNELVMSLPELAFYFFPRVPVHKVRDMLDAMNVTLYKPNSLQLSLLAKNKVVNPSGENSIVLVSISDVLQYMPQLKYMMRNLVDEHQQPANKRPRAS